MGFRRPLAYLALATSLLIPVRNSMAAQKQTSTPEQIEWTWEVRPEHPDPALPNVLLLGDSISRNYYPQVAKDLSGTANVYLLALSTSVGDPRLSRQIMEFIALERVTFSVVHFNNGMHGWSYSEAQYRAAFPQLLRTVRRMVGRSGSLMWASITPVQPHAFNGATNDRIDERNRIALAFATAAGLPLDDQYALMSKHQDLYEDTVHFGPAGAALMGDQAASLTRNALLRRSALR
jgi:hypothetical protein